MPGSDDRIQVGSGPSEAVRSDSVADGASPYRTRRAGTLFGAFVGIPLGATVAGICVWLADYGDYAWDAALWGGGAGLLAGAAIGFLERTLRGDLVRVDIATYTGTLFGLLVAAAFLIGFGGPVASRMFIGILCIGPMGGLLFGAIFDRAYDSLSQREWGQTLVFGGIGAAGCIAILAGITAYSDPDPDEIAKEAWSIVADRWRTDPALKAAKITKIELDAPVHRTYSGIMEASLAGNVQRFDLTVHVRHDTVTAEWVPRK